MIRVVIRRLLISIPVLLVVSILTFVLVSFLPGNAAQSLLGETATPATIAKLRVQLRLNEPLYLSYWHWLTTLFHGSLGNSLLNGQSVTSTLNQRIPVTLALVTGTTVVAAVIGILLGMVGALRGGVVARVTDFLTFTGLAMPSFFVGLGLVALLANKWHVFPPNGYVSPTQSLGGWARALVLPIIAMALSALSSIATQTRDAMLDAMGRDYVRVQFANGFSRRSIIFKHALRNATPSIITVIGLVFVSLLSAAVVVESIFSLPGLGQQVVSSATYHDIPVVQGVVLYFTIMVLLVNLIIDLAYLWADPRVRV